ncbi:hypothetical protein [Phormidesmis priestleyi]
MDTQTLPPAAIEHIHLLSEQLNQLYRSMQAERQAIAQWEEDREFSILGVLELFSSDIEGYVEQILSNVIITNPEKNLAHLRKLNLFDIDYFVVWYFANLDTYPQVKQYTEQLDHLRLLLIEHFETRR